MKKLFSFIAFILVVGINAQEATVNDALQFSQNNMIGTARFRSMGGAFGALGGDLSSIYQNPAGSVVFNNNFASLSLSNFNVRNTTDYFGTRVKDNDVSFDLNQAGVVFLFENIKKDSPWKKFSIAINYENTNNYDNTVFVSGINPNNSIGNYFLNFAQNVPLSDLVNFNFNQLPFPIQQAYLGYDTYIFDPVQNSPSNTQYFTNVPLGGNYYQEYYSNSDGYNSKLTFNSGAAYEDKLYIGANLNLHLVDIRRYFSVFERNSNQPYEEGSTIQSIFFENQLYTFGGGFSFNLGAIYRPTPSTRLGLSYESPTWYRLTDQLTQGVRTRSLNNPDGVSTPTSLQDTNEYLPYTIQTPSRWTGSLAYVFNKKGLVSADISMKDYSQTRYKPKNSTAYQGLNNFMSNNLDNAFEVRLGAEYKIKQVSLRAGYRFDQSPYINNQQFGDLNGYSGGLGYTFGASRIDLAFAHEVRNINQSLISSGMNDQARLNRKNNTILITYNINF